MRRDNVEHLVLSGPDGASRDRKRHPGSDSLAGDAVTPAQAAAALFFCCWRSSLPHAGAGRAAAHGAGQRASAAAAPRQPQRAANGGLSIDLNGSGLFTDRMLQIVALITVLSIAPSILIMMTSFVRIVVVLSLLRTAMGLQQCPPNSVIVSLAMFLTLFVMTPTLTDAYQPGHRADDEQSGHHRAGLHRRRWCR